ncbi:hypothetical protein IAT38_004563 [Cryptococcus sp. DSM 104549]
MNSNASAQDDPSTIDSILQYPRQGEDNEIHALQQYFENGYAHADSDVDPNLQAARDIATDHAARTSSPHSHSGAGIGADLRAYPAPSHHGHDGTVQSSHGHAHHHDPHHAHHQHARSPSPVNPQVAIPPALARLAPQALDRLELPPIPPTQTASVIDQAASLVDYGERGEMGGKRRKQPHERAGWREMDGGQPSAKRRRGGRKDDGMVGHDGEGSGSIRDHEGDIVHTDASLTELSRMALTGVAHPPPTEEATTLSNEEAAAAVAAAASALAAGPGTPVPEPHKTASPAPAAESPGGSKLSRAEQNKRAQQAFRRRREEHMKALERDQQSLGLLRTQYAQQESALNQLVLSKQADQIQIAALKSVIRSYVPHLNIAALNSEGGLAFEESPELVPDVERAFEELGRQSRELAKQHSRQL